MISDVNMIKSLLKHEYKDKVESLFFRNDPAFQFMKKERVEGKSANFPALYGRGGAVGGDFTKAKLGAASNTKAAEFQVVPGQLFSVYSMNSQEVAASKSLKGAYMPIAGAKMFSATEALRKVLAGALYGMGYGELCYWTNSNGLTASTPVDIVIPEDAAIKIDVDTKLLLKTAITTAETSATAILTVNSIGATTAAGTTINVTPDTTVAATTPATEYVISLQGSMNGNDPLLPQGLSAWIPYVGKRTGATWSNGSTGYIDKSFMSVSRNTAVDRLAGQFYSESSSTAKKFETVQQLLRRVRMSGSKADLVILNDKDWLDIANEIQTTNTYLTKTLDTAKGKKVANIGSSDILFQYSTSWIDKVVDSPYCPQGVFYILDTDAFKFWSYFNADKIDDGLSNNEAGKPDVTSENGDVATRPLGLLIDDYIDVTAGSDSVSGPSVNVVNQIFGSFVINNPSNVGVGLFYNANPIGSKLFA